MSAPLCFVPEHERLLLLALAVSGGGQQHTEHSVLLQIHVVLNCPDTKKLENEENLQRKILNISLF